MVEPLLSEKESSGVERVLGVMLLPSLFCTENWQQKLAGDMEGGRAQLPSLKGRD